ncbi:MAG: DUF3658 domain-containing protein [Hyphomicrobiaceae bacterium]
MTELDGTESAVPATTPEQDAAVDALILSCATTDACKVAILIARVVDAGKAQGLALTSAEIAPRIYALAEVGTLSVQGNVRRWRAAEVKKGA